MSKSFGWFRQLALKLYLMLAIALCATQAMAAPALATGIYSMPQTASSTWVLDEAEQISRLNEGKIESALKQLAQATGDEVRLVTIHRLDYGETAQTFADQLIERWFPSVEAQANQTVIVLDDVTNNMGIRVGENSAEMLTPEIAQSVIGETMKVPLLRGNQYNQAFLNATDRLVAVLSGETDPGPPEYDNTVDTDRNFATAEETEATRGSSTTLVVVLLIAATVIPMATYYWYISAGG
ncbi:MAG: YgcG family protein [Phormidesmis sp. RL_2_1]|nr:YgcG family protein [Phormidesmis sp. RL_2_1]